jgi:peptidyl-prolyl cis-trans isomerase C
MTAAKFRTLCALLLFPALLLSAPATLQAAPAAASADTVALVNGVPVSRDLLEVFSQATTGLRFADVEEAQRNALLDALIRAEIVAQQAEKLGVSAPASVDIPHATPGQLAFARLQALSQAGYEAMAREHEPTDAELMGAYQRQIARLPRLQYHAHHILLGTEAAAEHIIQQLQGGANFEMLASKESIDPGRGNGGDLGWFSLATLPQPFAAALRTMKKAETSAHPVQTSFGWHVIRLDDTRTLVPPTFESQREQLAATARDEKMQVYLSGLFKSADVQKLP